MRLYSEASFYTVLLTVLILIAVLLPVLMMQGYKPPHRYIFLGNSSNRSNWGKYSIIHGIPPDLRHLEIFFRPDKKWKAQPSTTIAATSRVFDTLDDNESSSTITTTTADNTNKTEDNITTSAALTSITMMATGDIIERNGLTHLIYDYIGLNEWVRFLKLFFETHMVWFSREEIGKSEEGNSIDVLKVAKPHKTNSMVLIVGGIYGKDVNSFLLVVGVMNMFLKHRENATSCLNTFKFHFIPLLNPDGYVYATKLPPVISSWKGNKNGVNILYDFGNTKAKESNVFKKYVQAHKEEIAAVFFLFSDDEKEYTISFPNIMAKRGSVKHSFIQYELFGRSTNNETKFNYSEALGDNSSRIDEWVVKTLEPKQVLVLDVLMLEFHPQSQYGNNTALIEKWSEILYKMFTETVMKTYIVHKEYMGLQ